MKGGEPPVDDPFEDDALLELREIRDRLQPLGVLEGLSPEQQLVLADRVWVFDDGYRRFTGDPDNGGVDQEFIRTQKVYRQKTPGQIKRLNKKLRALREAAEAVIAEVKKVRTSDNRYLAYQIDNRSVPVRLEELDFMPQAEHLAQLSRAVDLIEFPPEDASHAPDVGSLPTTSAIATRWPPVIGLRRIEARSGRAPGSNGGLCMPHYTGLTGSQPRRENDPEGGGTRPTGFESDRKRSIERLEEFVAHGPGGRMSSASAVRTANL